ncbi:hypothetical protein P154DRAFT_525756 [Amniculicola lignicola CBS 123094]|uniref:Uncharacterized protein n=1 Tax=Amniculicola lignicola CBS 123094 TaxID=1392246 RepID=A0A6A5W5G9_9PLEO|nr:hypothetical protein P154DRAFT_525756 [Amniculicola lignicola CBS 123094]
MTGLLFSYLHYGTCCGPSLLLAFDWPVLVDLIAANGMSLCSAVPFVLLGVCNES